MPGHDPELPMRLITSTLMLASVFFRLALA